MCGVIVTQWNLETTWANPVAGRRADGRIAAIYSLKKERTLPLPNTPTLMSLLGPQVTRLGTSIRTG
jgi:hypothetical protein